MPSDPRRPDAILVRHFASPLNERKVSRGWLSVGIDKERAEKQVPGVAKALARYGVDSLVSSDLPRAQQSAKLIAQEMGGDIPVESTAALRTWNVGSMAGKKEAETIPLRQKFIKYAEEKPKGGEPFQDFLDRYQPELEEIMHRREQGEGVAFVAHGHHLLAAPHILQGEEVDPKKLTTLDEDYEPGAVYGFFRDGNKARIERLDKKESA